MTFEREPLLVVALFLSGYLLLWAAEWRRHRINLRFLLFAGATLRIPKLTRSYYLILFVLLPIIVLEALGSWSWQVSGLQITGLALVGAGLFLRLWTLTTLGSAWTMTCLYWPQMPRIQRGPFRFFKHPEYLSRLMDGVGLCLALNAGWSALIMAVSMTALAIAIVRVENSDLDLMKPEVSETDETDTLMDAGFVP